MYIDLHNHYLPGVDDGVQKMEETLLGLKLAVKEKVGAICFTPHIWKGRCDNSPEKLKEVFERVREEAKEIKVKLFLGSEVYYSSTIADDFSKGLYVPIGVKKKFLLVEFGSAVMPKGVSDGLYKLMLEGCEPIIAHPERYSYVQKDYECLFDFAKAQIPMQVTTQAIMGMLGRRAQKTAVKLLDEGLVSFIASDAHNPEKRPLLFREAVRFINRRYGRQTTKRLAIDNPKRILEGKPLLPVAGKKGKFSQFL
jgi:protein-tyrosine phosphatase